MASTQNGDLAQEEVVRIAFGGDISLGVQLHDGLASALGETIPRSQALARGRMISRAIPRSNRRQAATAQPHLVGRPVVTGGGAVLTSMSQPRAQQCVHDSVVWSLPGRCPSRPGAIAGGAARAALSGGAGEGVRVSEPWGDARR